MLDGRISFCPLHTPTYTQLLLPREDPGRKLVKRRPLITSWLQIHRSQPRGGSRRASKTGSTLIPAKEPDAGSERAAIYDPQHYWEQKSNQLLLWAEWPLAPKGWSLNHLWMWPHSETASSQNVIKLKSLEWTLIQHDCCPHKKRNLDTHTHTEEETTWRQDTMWRQRQRLVWPNRKPNECRGRLANTRS